MRQALAAGIEGFYSDNWAQLIPWGFDLAAHIRFPCSSCTAAATRPCQFSHAQWLAARIPGVEARFYDDEGHGLRDDHIGEVHAWLAERL